MSQLLSHFTAFFIIMVTETSIVESCIYIELQNSIDRTKSHLSNSIKATNINAHTCHQEDQSTKAETHTPTTNTCKGLPLGNKSESSTTNGAPVTYLFKEIYVSKVWMRGNDPSAGSPTETLLRLHLPLNDKV